MSPTSPSVLEREREVMRECMNEAFWARAVPVSLATGLFVHQLIRLEKIKASRYGGLPIIVGSSCLAYCIGKYTYIFGDNCARKFAEKVPDSEISKKFIEKQEAVNEFSVMGYKISWRTSSNRDTKLPNSYPSLHDKILPDLEHLTEMENNILDDCRTASIWNYSFPMAIFGSSFIYSLMAYKILNGSKHSKNFPRAPKTIFGAILGYGAGQLAYVFSKDCPDRFLTGAPEGEVARLLKGEYDETEESASDEGTLQANYLIPEETQINTTNSLRQQQAF